VALRAIVQSLREGDARLTDLLALNVSDLDHASREANLTDQAKEPHRALPFSQEATALLREASDGHAGGPLFHAPTGQRHGRETVTHQMQATTGFTPHEIRAAGRKQRHPA
ncbi:hypothetical protein, partial [Streptomyces beijiangensis]